MNTYDKGDAVRCSAVFKNPGGTLIDPDTVTFKHKDPSGNVATLVYGTDAAVVKDSTGSYHVDVDADEKGTWHYRWESTGTGQAADEGSFEVDSEF